jgi:hypothetical protein
MMEGLKAPAMPIKYFSKDVIEVTFRSVRCLYSSMMYKDKDLSKLCPNITSFCITFDGWTDFGRKNTYVSLTRHWIPDDSWLLTCVVMDVIPFTGIRHTGQNMMREIAVRLRDMSQCILYNGTVDNAANVVKALDLVLKTLSPVHIDPEKEGFTCQDHTLDLSVRGGFYAVPTAVEDVELI